MSGLKLVIPNFTSNNASLPILREDKRLTAGSLLLVDFSHPLSPTAIPATGGTVANIAYSEASLITGSAQSNVNALAVTNTLTTGSGLAEITSKKGLHIIKSQVNDVSGSGFRLAFPTAIHNYIHNNISRGFYVSTWYRNTRLSTSSSTGDLLLGATSTSNLIAVQQRGSWLPTTFAKKVDPTNQLGVYRADAYINVLTGTPSVATGSMWKVGAGGIYTELNTAPSKMLYQIHIIDLTSAGLTYEQAKALDIANFNQAFGIGGRFENDTFTNPSTLA